MSGLWGIWGRPYVDLDGVIDTACFAELDREIALALADLETTHTGGSLKWMGVTAPWVNEDPYRDLGHVIARFSRDEFLRFVAALYGQSGAGVERRLGELLELFELEPWRDELTESYSHGMRQKLLIASALVHRPEVIVVDEPMVGLDPRSARLLKDLLRRFVDRGGTVLMSTHTLEVAEAMCDRIGIIVGGRFAACGTLEELRLQTASAGSSLEEMFLKLTGALPVESLDAVLEA